MTKFHGNGYFTIRNAFNAFDYDKRGFVSKEAIYRIICNILNGITRQQFTELMQKLVQYHSITVIHSFAFFID